MARSMNFLSMTLRYQTEASCPVTRNPQKAFGVTAAKRYSKTVLTPWKDLSVSKKLYAVFGVMALLIALELFTLRFAMHTLSALRAFVEGEALWSKAQKNAIHSLHQYAFTGEAKYYDDFQKHLVVPAGDHKARMEVSKPDYDHQKTREGFEQGGIHPEDIDGVISLLRRFHEVSYLKKAVGIWTAADVQLESLVVAGEELHEAIQKRRHASVVRAALTKIGVLNDELTVLEADFSRTLGEGSRWLEGILLFSLLMAVLTVECTGLLLTFSFSRNLGRSLREITDAAQRVGQGDFSAEVPVRSRDELGQLAGALNTMIKDLQRNIGERQQAESASQTKTLFLASMSHEIRSPLGVILGFTEILKDPSLPEKDRIKYLETIDRTGKNLSRIINDILDISKVEAGHLDIEITTFSFPELIEEISSMLQLRAHGQGTALTFEPRGRVPNLISTDRVRLRQVLLNVVGNALKYTDKGRVRVVFGLLDGLLTFEVTDTGAGIPREQQAQLFQRFVRAESARVHEGAGLGLMLSRGLARVLGGDVVLKESAPGRGSTFVVTIHAALPDETRVSSSNETLAGPDDALIGKLKGKRVLVVDDTPENQAIVQLYLGKRGVEIELAENGQDAVDKAMAGQFDLILMDVQMPVMDGYTATKTLRSRGFKKPIIALTAHAMKEDQKKCFEVGCSAYASKPIEWPTLIQTMVKSMEIQ